MLCSTITLKTVHCEKGLFYMEGSLVCGEIWPTDKRKTSITLVTLCIHCITHFLPISGGCLMGIIIMPGWGGRSPGGGGSAAMGGRPMGAGGGGGGAGCCGGADTGTGGGMG